jgi:NADH-quinone oxidoreductase subunit H
MLLRVFIFPGALYLILAALVVSWLDRKMVALWQARVGPPWYQPFADLVKLLAKEDVLPRGSSAHIAAALPILSLACTLTAGLYVPICGIAAASFQGDLIVVLFLLSVPTLAYFLAGWLTASVYGIIGGNRSLLQYFAYEVPLLMGMAAPAVMSKSLNIVTLMEVQQPLRWHALMLPVGLIVALLGLIGKLKRAPFDIPNAKSEVGAGPLTDYSGRKLALWKLTIALQTVVGINLLVAVYLGGGIPAWGLWGVPIYIVKAFAVLAVLSLVQVLYARLRIDQLSRIGWRLLVPLGLAQLLFGIWI